MRSLPLRTRWTLACKDLLCRVQYVTTTVDQANGRITIRIRGCGTTIVLRPSDVRRLRRHLAEALIVLIVLRGSWPDDEE